jgi:hypothetical protein
MPLPPAATASDGGGDALALSGTLCSPGGSAGAASAALRLFVVDENGDALSALSTDGEGSPVR